MRNKAIYRVADPNPHEFELLNAEWIREGKMTIKNRKVKKFHVFEVLDVLFWALNASPFACASFMESQGRISKFLKFFGSSKSWIRINNKKNCWIRIRNPDYLAFFFLPEKLFVCIYNFICILKSVPNFEVYSYSGNVVATETVVREPKNKIKMTYSTEKKVKLTKAPNESGS